MNAKDIHEGQLYIRIKDTTQRVYDKKYAIYNHGKTTKLFICQPSIILLGGHYKEGYVIKAGWKDNERWNKGVYDENFIFHNAENIQPYEGDYIKTVVNGDKLYYYSTFMQRGLYSIRNHEISTIQELCLYSKRDLLRVHGVGTKSLKAIEQFMITVNKKLRD